MNDKGNKSPADPRKDRLGAALRENLKRRKAQAKARAASGGPGDQSQKPDLYTFSPDDLSPAQGRSLSGDNGTAIED